ncbi:MAG: hypothetical protein K0R52_989 [Alphaproteobacteria bacterium]|nr:hypothetical protein [Alphaproteobacteria bacterium]
MKIIVILCAALSLSGCCGMYTNCSQPSNNTPGANCGVIYCVGLYPLLKNNPLRQYELFIKN